MARISLKNILSGKTAESVLISSLIEKLNAAVYIEDINQKVLLGKVATVVTDSQPVTMDEETIGWVKGNEQAPVIASLLNLMIQKEAEKKKIASEVLLLYQEVNMIFNFSEKLAQTIGQTSIAAITLDEAGRLIKSDNGLILLWDEESNQIEVARRFRQTVV